MARSISGAGSITGSGNIMGQAAGGGSGGAIIASGTTIGFLRFDGGMMSDEVQINLYSEDQTAYPMWNDYTSAMGIAIQNAIDTNQNLQITMSGFTDEVRDGELIPFSWFNGVKQIVSTTLFDFSNDANFRIFFGNKNDLNIPNLPNINTSKESTTGVTWAISLA